MGNFDVLCVRSCCDGTANDDLLELDLEGKKYLNSLFFFVFCRPVVYVSAVLSWFMFLRGVDTFQRFLFLVSSPRLPIGTPTLPLCLHSYLLRTYTSVGISACFVLTVYTTNIYRP